MKGSWCFYTSHLSIGSWKDHGSLSCIEEAWKRSPMHSQPRFSLWTVFAGRCQFRLFTKHRNLQELLTFKYNKCLWFIYKTGSSFSSLFKGRGDLHNIEVAAVWIWWWVLLGASLIKNRLRALRPQRLIVLQDLLRCPPPVLSETIQFLKIPVWFSPSFQNCFWSDLETYIDHSLHDLGNRKLRAER